MKIDDIELKIDYREELEAFDWERPTWKPEKLIACSPFRDERQPSFYIWLEDTETSYAGQWQDSGSFDPEWSRGGFIKLLAYLRNESEATTVDYLLEKYAPGYLPESRMALKPHARFGLDKPDHMDDAKLKKLMFRHPYLGNRGIAEHVQRSCKIGYDRESKAVSIPWFDARGRLITIKYRKVTNKFFWYDEDGTDITAHLWGMQFIHKHRPKEAVLVEAEIDAMWLMSCGIFAIATGNKYFNRQRAELIIKSSIERLIIGRDNDDAGKEMQDKVVRYIGSSVQMAEWKLPSSAKDINDIRDESLVKAIVEQAKDIKSKPLLRM